MTLLRDDTGPPKRGRRSDRLSLGRRGRRRWRRWALALATCCAMVAAGTTSSHAGVAWQGFARLPGKATCGDGAIDWRHDAEVGWVIRMSVHEKTDQNSVRCEVAVARRLLADGMTVYLGWKSKIVAPPSGRWNNLLQLKAHGDFTVGYTTAMRVGGGRLTLDKNEDINGVGTPRSVWSVPLPQDRWFSILLKVHYSENPQIGYLQLWFDGQPQTFVNGTTIDHGQTWDGSENNVHWGIYRSDEINGTQTHDLWRPRIATTISDADPNAGGGDTWVR